MEVKVHIRIRQDPPITVHSRAAAPAPNRATGTRPAETETGPTLPTETARADRTRGIWVITTRLLRRRRPHTRPGRRTGTSTFASAPRARAARSHRRTLPRRRPPQPGRGQRAPQR